MTTTTQDPITQVIDQTTSKETIPAKPNRHEVIDQICHETGCTREKADTWLRWLTSTLGALRSSGQTIHYMTVGEMRRHHAILDTIAPDDTVAQPGSAHAMVQDFVLKPGQGEVALTHSRTEQFHEVYCSVEVGVMTVSTS